MSTTIGTQAIAIDCYSTTGTSPTARARNTIHLLGAGAVGSAFLQRVPEQRRRLVAVTDSTATIYDPRGIAPESVIAWKAAGRPLREHPLAHCIPAAHAIAAVDADVLVDATSSDLDRAGWTAALDSALRRGAALALAAKPSLCEAGAEWLGGDHAVRVGCNAVLGGTGRAFSDQLHALRSRWRGATIVGNASTTTIIEAIERGSSLAEGITEAQRLGYLEPDPELDLRGVDAAVKLAIVAGVLTGRRIDPLTISCDDVRALDSVVLRGRSRRGETTRLVGRLDADGSVRVSYESVSRDSLLAAPCGRVVYEYLLQYGERRLHIGRGIGAAATAEALWTDVRALCATAAGSAVTREV